MSSFAIRENFFVSIDKMELQENFLKRDFVNWVPTSIHCVLPFGSLRFPSSPVPSPWFAPRSIFDIVVFISTILYSSRFWLSLL